MGGSGVIELVFTTVILLAPGLAFVPAVTNEAALGHGDFMPCNLVEAVHLNLSWTKVAMPIDLRGIIATSTDAALSLFGPQFYNFCIQDQAQYREPSRCVREIERTVLHELAHNCALTVSPKPPVPRFEAVEFSVTERVSDDDLPDHDTFANEKRWLERLAHTDVIAAPLAFDDTRHTIVTAYAGVPLDAATAPDDLAAQLEHILGVLAAHNCRHNIIIPQNVLVLDSAVRLVDFSWAWELDRPIAAAWYVQVLNLGKPALGLRCTGMFDDRCAVENAIERIAPERRPDSAEAHPIIDWTEHYTEEFLEAACQRVGLEVVRALAMPNATRHATMPTFYGANINALDPCGATQFRVYVIRDVAPRTRSSRGHTRMPPWVGNRRRRMRVPSITSHICENEGRREEHLAKKERTAISNLRICAAHRPSGSPSGPAKENHAPRYRTASAGGTVDIVCSRRTPSLSSATKVIG